jgi:hypothetical protein
MFPVDTIKNTEEVEVQLHSFFNKALDGGEQLTTRPGRFVFGNKRWYPLRGKMALLHDRTGLIGGEKFLGFDPWTIQPLL